MPRLGDAVLNNCSAKTRTSGTCEPTWRRVERALPVMRYSFGNRQASGNAFMCSPYSPESGVRTFTGSRGASVDQVSHSGPTFSTVAQPQAMQRLNAPGVGLAQLPSPTGAHVA